MMLPATGANGKMEMTVRSKKKADPGLAGRNARETENGKTFHKSTTVDGIY